MDTDKRYLFLTAAKWFILPKPVPRFKGETKDEGRGKRKGVNHNGPKQVKNNPSKRNDRASGVCSCRDLGSLEPAQEQGWGNNEEAWTQHRGFWGLALCLIAPLEKKLGTFLSL